MEEDSVRAAAAAQEAYEKLKRQVGATMGGWLVKGAQGIQAAAAYLGSGGDWGVAGDTVFGKAESYDPLAAKAENDRKAASADAMRKAATARRDAAIAAANKWFAQAADKISVGNVSAADSLAQMGGYVGGRSSQAGGIAERQLKIMELQEQLQERIARATEGTLEQTTRTADGLEE